MRSSKVSPVEVAQALLDGAERAKKAKILVVGCGGIGCELLKNLVRSRTRGVVKEPSSCLFPSPFR